MKQSTIKKYTKILSEAKASGKSLKAYCSENNLNYNSVVTIISSLRKQHDAESEDVKELINLCNDVSSKGQGELFKEEVETDDRAETSFIRDEEGKIQYYGYQIYRKNKNPLIGKLTREEMNTIHRLYSYYGDALTQRVISRHFVDLSLVDFKRILRAFNITKASAPFAPHMIEERSEEELREIQLREKENSFLRKAEEDQIKNNEKLLKKYAQENIELKNQIRNLANFEFKVPEIEPIKIEQIESTGMNLNLYLADIHIGAKVTSGALYKENVEYGTDEIKRRLSKVLEKLKLYKSFNTINLVLMGDNVDCCGVNGRTARLDHEMPENMDAREQANKFIEIMMWFVDSIIANKFCNSMRIFSVPNGNHGGIMEYMCNKAFLGIIKTKYPEIQTTLWEEFFGIFEQNNNVFICSHGN